MLHALLVHQAHGRVRQRQEAVVFLVQPVAVARERVHEQFQLVVCPLADVDAHASEGVFQVIGTLLQIRTGRYTHYHVEVHVHQLFALAGYHVLHPLDVLDGHLVARIRNAGVPVLLLVEQREFTLLSGQEDDLVVHHRLGVRDAVDDRYEVHRHFRVVHLDIRVRAYQRGQRGAVHVHEAVHLAAFVAHRHRFVVRLEVRHRHDTVFEVHREIAVHILARFGLVQESHLHAAVAQLVVYFADLHEEIAPLLAVIREQAAFLRLLRDGQVTKAVRVRTSLEIAEIRGREELPVALRLICEPLSHENILLVESIPFAQGQRKRREQICELVVAVDVGRILLHWVLDFQDGGVFPRLGVQHADSVRIFHREIDVLKDAFAFAARAERIDGQGHARAQGDEE